MFVLNLHCCDKPGVVAAVATSLSNADCNIEDSAQFNDRLSGCFFMRVVFKPLHEGAREAFEAQFQSVVEAFDMVWAIHDLEAPVKTLLLVSKPDHCLNDLLYRHRTGNLNIEITGVVSNHETNRQLVEDRGLAFHYLPISKDTKPRQEAAIADVVEETGSELIVLARYMQVLSSEMCDQYAGRVINIHHSFLPGFKGAKPYHQAYERGVKITGATAHFATSDLDEGPIIEQEIRRIDHSYRPDMLAAAGRDTEAQVLARAIRLYSERRIFMHGKRTIIL
jgi:formyltetrahydrofolate deformylase